MLKKKVFKLVSERPPFPETERTELVQSCLRAGAAARLEGRQASVTADQLAALGQAKLAFVQHAFVQLARFGAKAVASIVDASSPRPNRDFLRKDYSYLFERFYYILEEGPRTARGSSSSTRSTRPGPTSW